MRSEVVASAQQMPSKKPNESRAAYQVPKEISDMNHHLTQAARPSA